MVAACFASVGSGLPTTGAAVLDGCDNVELTGAVDGFTSIEAEAVLGAIFGFATC